ncbi:MAG: hypothetical protein LQ347_003091 [Umbilicaria vellea]|nr:MAG: hypothetical protein LQ347_003091 [Umbilicaria vellea]
MANDPTRYLPLKPSNLRVPSGPISPASPLTPPAPREPSPPYSAFSSSSSTSSDAAPELPMPWVWTCHLCRSRYPLAATRRCLDDGHHFCAGTSTDRRNGRIKKHSACGSEFDYTGWKAYGDWRRRYTQEDKPDFVHGSKDCSKHCDYPSECRWTAKRAAKSSRLGEHVLSEDKRSKTTLAKIVRSAEQRTGQSTNRLSSVEEEGEQSSTATPKGSDLILPRLDFTGSTSNFTTFDSILGNTKDDAMDVDLPRQSEPQITVQEVEVDPDDDTMDIDPPYEKSEPPIITKEFEFGFEQDSQTHGQTSPTSPRRNAWDWSIGAIGAALTFADITEDSDSSSDEDVDMINGK